MGWHRCCSVPSADPPPRRSRLAHASAHTTTAPTPPPPPRRWTSASGTAAWLAARATSRRTHGSARWTGASSRRAPRPRPSGPPSRQALGRMGAGQVHRCSQVPAARPLCHRQPCTPRPCTHCRPPPLDPPCRPPTTPPTLRTTRTWSPCSTPLRCPPRSRPCLRASEPPGGRLPLERASPRLSVLFLHRLALSGHSQLSLSQGMYGSSEQIGGLRALRLLEGTPQGRAAARAGALRQRLSPSRVIGSAARQGVNGRRGRPGGEGLACTCLACTCPA